MAADSVEQVIYNYLTADTVFSAKFTGIYYIEADAQTYPYIVYWMVDDIGTKTYINNEKQGEARVQFDLWDDNKIRGARLRSDIRDKVDSMNETRDGYTVTTVGINEQTIQRDSGADPFHFVVDGVIQWQE